ncbi:MAG: MarR family transcriptional regulator [Shinella sp.]|nr:MarR family transcriptional regulator [Shinella sp.]
MRADFDLNSFLPYRLNRATEFVSLGFAALYRDRYGMTRPEWRTLAALGANSRMTATEIGIHSSMHKTKVSRAVRALEKRRWLKRSENEADRRVEHLELTDLGIRHYRELVELARGYEKVLSGLLGEDGLSKLEAGLAAAEKAIAASARRTRGRKAAIRGDVSGN